MLTTGMLLSVIGLGILASSRATNRAIAQTTDLAEATVLAESGVEWGLSAIKNNAAWRTTYTNNVSSMTTTMGRGRFAFKLVDSVDANLSNNTSDAVRVYGIGYCGAATRAYSVELTGGGPSLEILKKPIHTGGNLTVTSSLTATGGALSSNGTLTVNSGATVTGDVEAVSLVVSGTVTGARTTVTSRSMPASTVFDLYKAQATTIPFSSIPSGIIQKELLSSAVNPYGSLNASGVYYVRVPSTGTLTVRNSRLVATLVVEIDPGGKFITSNSFVWEPPRSGLPSLLINATGTATVTLGHSSIALSESGQTKNFNPAGTPNSSGVADTDLTDSYASEFRGLIHIMGTGFTTSFSSFFNLVGSAIVEGNATTGASVKMTADPTLASSPPAGYSNASSMLISPFTWRWEPGQ